VFDQIVNQPTVTLPIAGTVGSYTPLIGYGGVVGVKSGFTSAAGGCDLLALVQSVHGQRVEILSAVLGDQVGDDVITGAGLAALDIARQALAHVQLVTVAAPGQRVATVTVAGYSAPVIVRSGVSMLAWPGQRLVETLEVDRPPPAGTPAGWRIGAITARLGPQRRAVAASTALGLPTPSFFQRVF
jgi:serine-type D-Ala-D-Ala carboxypeptidase (penicillin-binding protein 5/6)